LAKKLFFLSWSVIINTRPMLPDTITYGIRKGDYAYYVVQKGQV